MKISSTLFFIFLILFFPLSSFAQETPLSPGEAEFQIPPIYIPDGKIHLTGNSTYLVTYWEAYYWDGSERGIGGVCFLNCDEREQDCSSAQNCSVVYPPGRIGGCSILHPNYRGLNSTNYVSCRIYDPNHTDTKGYLNATFIPIEFSVWFSNYSSVVGEEFNFPVNIKNSGLFSDTYKIQAWSNNPSKVYINPETQSFSISLHGDAFDPHVWNQTGPDIKQVYIKVAILDATDNIDLCVNVTSSFGFTEPTSPCIALKANYKSMPELGLIQILLIMLTATIFIFKLKKRF